MLATIMTGCYVLSDTGFDEMVTGLVGVYDDMDEAVKAWNETLKKLNVPEDRTDLYDTIGHAYIYLDSDGNYIPPDDSDEEPVYMMELMSKMVKLNVTYRAVS